MNEYPKINSLYKRDDDGNFILGKYSDPSFEYLKNNIWIGTEKIDGTNIRVCWENKTLSIHGRTEKSQTPTFLLEKLHSIFDNIDFESIFGEQEVILFGEGYGDKIQKVGKLYLPEDNNFILFDVKIGKWWLKREDVISIASQLNIQSVPVVFNGTIDEAITFVKKGFKSTIGEADAEGLVLIPKVDLLERSGKRIITKLKTSDFV